MRWLLLALLAAVFILLAHQADRLPAPSWREGYQDYFDRNRPR